MKARQPLERGTRVRHRTDEGKVGTVTEHRQVGQKSPRWAYMVHWDGNDHDSGEYGIRDLEYL